MPASNVFMNWTGVSATPTNPVGPAISLGEITDVQIDGKSVQKAFYGDARRFALLIRNTQKTREITIVGANIAKLLTIPEDAECTIVAILNDVTNGEGSGALTITAVRAKSGSRPFQGANNEFAKGTMKFACAGGVNDADPISIAVAI
ncbi:MAG: hypothetical protein M3P94_07225 [Chloroflexota bacterium]|nr:hypothetical protein [Chloroflexota bacterium]